MNLFGPVPRYGDYGSGAGPSPRIVGLLRKDPEDWITYSEDFLSASSLSSSGAIANAQTYGFLDTSDTMALLATEVGGVLRISTAATDNNGPILTTGYNVAGMLKFTASKSAIFECRVRASSIATVSYFFGLGEEGLAANNGIISDTQTAAGMADKDYVGFAVCGDTSSSIANAVYHTETGTAVETKAAAATLVAATWIKLGIVYLPDMDQVRWVVDGLDVAGQTVTAISATGFPDGEELALYAMMKNGSGAIRTLDVDWWYAAMER